MCMREVKPRRRCKDWMDVEVVVCGINGRGGVGDGGGGGGVNEV